MSGTALCGHPLSTQPLTDEELAILAPSEQDKAMIRLLEWYRAQVCSAFAIEAASTTRVSKVGQ
uniref:Uncharacterized protein n=1 Tax=viral metagenome TaxID=1070528 RepID=A0A6M3LQ08_9ZZZZ